MYLWSKGQEVSIFGQYTKQIVADDILKFILFFRENKTWHFLWIVRLADNSHEMSIYFL